MLDGTLSVNWKTDYAGEFICPNCNQGKINNFHHSQKPICKLRLECDSCSQITNLTCEVPQHPPISIHQTLDGTLQVNWKTDYAGEFICPQCNQGQLNRFSYSKGSVCKLRLGCDFCHQVTYLTGKFKHLPISIHQTLQGTLSVNWAEQYVGEFICPQCNQGQISKFHYDDGLSCQLKLGCNSCSLKTLLCCQVPPQFHSYRQHLVCPNPLCHQIGPDGQKGWIYESFGTNSSQSNCRCYFCHINFHPNATSYGSWVGYQQQETLLNFCFDDDVWDFRHFIKNSPVKILNFKSIKPEWFRVLVKQYLYSLLKSGRYSASAKPMNSLVALRQFSQILKPNNIHHLPEISRELILAFLDLNQSNCSRTIREKLYILKDFFDFFGLESQNLVRHRDIPKQTIQDVDWLDEITRQRIKQHLDKIPAPVARHYLVQEYTAARPADICQMAFDCLSECERLRTQIKQLTTPESSPKVVSLNSVPKKSDNGELKNLSQEITHLITEMGIKIGVRLKQEIAKHDVTRVKLAISAFEQYRSHNSIENPGACLLAMIRDEAEPNVPLKAMTPLEDEFERWYCQAIESGFCQDVPKKYLPIQQGEIQVRVNNDKFSSGYELLSWQIAKAKMELDEDSSIS